MVDADGGGGLTPSQTVGPFFHFGMTAPPAPGQAALADQDLAGPGTPGEKIVLLGVVLDGAGHSVSDALIEILQADGSGHLPGTRPATNSEFRGFGRAATDAEGTFRFRTVRPGRLSPQQAPHIALGLFGRGLLNRLLTRVYFDDEPANATDPVLALVPPDRRATLIARGEDSGHGVRLFRFAIRLQGPDETVFFAT